MLFRRIELYINTLSMEEILHHLKIKIPITIERDEVELSESIYQPTLRVENILTQEEDVDFSDLFEVLPALKQPTPQMDSTPVHGHVNITIDRDFIRVPHLEWISDRRNKTLNPNPPIFTRFPAWRQIFKHLGNAFAKVEGEPGSGKTTAAWCWFLQTALLPANADKTSVWISLNLERRITIRNRTAVVERFYIDSHSFTKTKYAGGRHKVKPNLLIVDGITQLNCNLIKARDWIDAGIPEIKLLTSQQGLVTTAAHIPSEFVNKPVEAWELEHYYAACTNETFFDSVRDQLGGTASHGYYSLEEKKRLVDFKFFYGGYSTRFMFEYSVNEVITEIDGLMKRIPDLASFIKCDVGVQSVSAINKLVVSRGRYILFVSEYLARMLIQDIMTHHVIVLNTCDVVRRNPAMNGWALEIDFLHSVRSKMLINRVFDVTFPAAGGIPVVRGAVNASFQVTEQIHNFHRNYPEILNPDDIAVNHWFIPEVFNQGGFDCVQVINVEDNLVLRFVQVTRNTRHDLKLQYMRICLERFNQVLDTANLPVITRIHVVMLFPEEQLLLLPNPADHARWTIVGAPRQGIPQINYFVVVFQRLMN